MKDLVLAAITMTSRDDKTQNVAKAEKLVREAKLAGADWVLLPEIFHFFGPYKDLYAQAEEEGGPLLARLANLARELKIVLFAGTIGERPGTELAASKQTNAAGERRVYNTMYVFGRDGERLAKYRKVHLFNLLAPDGRRLYCEEDGFVPGNEPVAVDIEGVRVGLAICYDIRFPELFARLAAEKPLDVLVVPAAFTLKTGMDHWELLLKARAVEQQCYVMAANQAGMHAPEKESYGHSMILDPWGYKLADTGAVEGFALARFRPQRIEDVRGRLPALKNRRPDVYQS